MRGLSLILFIATIPAANWLVGNVGTMCFPGGPCVIPVGFGLFAPSGVLLVGLAFVLRDFVQQSLGARAALVGIVSGSVMSFTIAPPALAMASAAAFLVSEMADWAVYTPLRRRGFLIAVAISSLVGLVIDSAAFLWIAFGSLDTLMGQMVGKTWALVAALVVCGGLRHSRAGRS